MKHLTCVCVLVEYVYSHWNEYCFSIPQQTITFVKTNNKLTTTKTLTKP